MNADRIRRAVEGLAEGVVPRYLGVYEYRVVTVDAGNLLSLQATDQELVPDLARVDQRPGIGGSRTTPQPGALVLVAFVNGDPARPVIVGWDDTTPDVAALDGAAVELGAAVAAVVRIGDQITITPGNGGGVVTGVVAFLPGPPGPVAPSRVKA